MKWLNNLVDMFGSTMTTCKTCWFFSTQINNDGKFNPDTKKIVGRTYKHICNKYKVELENFKACDDHHWGG